MKVAVGSTNPTKIDPVKEIFSLHFKNVEVISVSVSSGVADQPLSEEETYHGALNRAKEALRDVKDAEYGVGIEGGLTKYPFGWVERSMVVIVNKKDEVGIGFSGGLVQPEKIMEKIHSGKNLEEAVDELFGTQKIGEGIGMFGIMTKGVVTRSSGVAHGVAFALARFLHENLY